MFRWFALLPALVLAFCAFGQDTVHPPTTPVELRSFDADAIGDLQRKYAYEQELTVEPTLWERFKEWLAEWLGDMLGEALGGSVADNLFLLIAVILLGIGLYYLSKGGMRGVFQGKARSLGDVDPSEEDIRDMDLEIQLHSAETNGDLRLAIRLHYLIVLRYLVDIGAITWTPDRTDRDYLAQIQDPALRARFAQAALVFQWVWYGEAAVESARYELLKRPFLGFTTDRAA